MNKTAIREQQERHQAFKVLLKPFFPTIGNIISLSDETSREMKAERGVSQAHKARNQGIEIQQKGFS